MISVERIRRAFGPAGLVLAAVLASPPSPAADGDLDPGFSGDGITTIAFAGGGVDNVRVAADDAGNVFVGGTIVRSGPNRDFAIAKLRPNGTLDNSFGFLGLRTVGVDLVANGSDRLHAIVPQADGKILLLGVAQTPDEISAAAPPVVVSLTANGNADTTFGNAGHVVFDTSPWPNASFYTTAAMQQRDGKLLFSGYCVSCPGTYRAFVLRVSANGVPDATFGTSGWISVPLSVQPRFETMGVDRLGRIVLAGSSVEGEASFPLIVRLTASGAADGGFGGGTGVARILDLPNTLPGGWTARAVAIGNDHSLVLAVSNFFPIDVNRTGLVRLNADGSRDTGYAGTGLRNLTLEDGSRIHALARRDDGRIVAAGWIDANGPAGQDFLLARVRPNGNLDPTFDANGLVRIPVVADNTDGAEAMILVAGKPVVAGYAYTGQRNIGVMRLQSDLVFADGME